MVMDRCTYRYVQNAEKHFLSHSLLFYPCLPIVPPFTLSRTLFFLPLLSFLSYSLPVYLSTYLFLSIYFFVSYYFFFFFFFYFFTSSFFFFFYFFIFFPRLVVCGVLVWERIKTLQRSGRISWMKNLLMNLFLQTTKDLHGYTGLQVYDDYWYVHSNYPYGFIIYIFIYFAYRVTITSLFFSFSPSLSVSVTLCLSLTLSLTLFLSLSVTISVFLFLSLSISLLVSVSLSVSVFHFFSLSLSPPLFLTAHFFHSISHNLIALC